MQNMQTITGRQFYLRLMRYIAPYWDALTVSLTCMIAMAATMPMLAALVLSMVDGVITGKNLELMQLILLGIIGIFAMRGVAGQVGAYTINWVGNKLAMDLRMKMFDKLLALPGHYCDGHTEYSPVLGITSGTSQLARTFTGLVTVMVKDTFTILGLLGWMFYLDWEFSLLALLIISAAVLILRLITKRLHAMELKAGQITDGLSRVLKDSVENQWVVKLHGGEKYEHQRMKEQAEEVSRLVMKQMAMASLYVPLIQITTAVSLAIIVYITAQQASADEITAGGFASLVAAMLMLIAPVKRVAGVKEALHLGLATAERVFWLLDQEAEPDAGTITIERPRGELKLEQVSFYHHGGGKNTEADPEADPKAGSEARLEPDAKSLLRDVTLTIQAGERVALIGLRASTIALARLVPRFVNPTSGRIMLDGHDLKSLKLASLEQAKGYTIGAYKSSAVSQRVEAQGQHEGQHAAHRHPPQAGCRTPHVHHLLLPHWSRRRMLVSPSERTFIVSPSQVIVACVSGEGWRGGDTLISGCPFAFRVIVSAEPAMMARKVTIEPSASVENPVIAWPMVQPSAVIPPKPISRPPTTWFAVSSASRKPSQRKVRVASA